MIERADFGQWSAQDVARLLALLEAQLAYYREIAAALPVPLAILSKHRSVIWTNRAFRRRFGTRIEDLRGFREIPLRAWHDEDETETLLVFESPEQVSGDAPSATGRSQRERQLFTAGRFDALYAFGGRLAHDLNNPLMIVTGYAEELMQALKPADPLREEAGEILGAARRIGGLAAQLTEFAKPQGKAPSRVNIGDSILNLRSKLIAAAGERAVLELAANRTPIVAMADPAQLGEVLAAVVAGPLKGTPRERTRITIAWDVETVKEPLSPGILGAGRYACIRVHDDGHGLDAEQAASVFDPVLSKTGDPAWAAKGLALASAYGIVRHWGGNIAFAGEPREGSTFTIYLPLAESDGVKSEGQPASAPNGGESATILVVDDETRIRELIRKILQREGYRVLEAGSAEDAITVARGQTIHLLITDVMLPGITGPELARRMQQAAPKLKTLYISGYTGSESIEPRAAFLAKPFTLAALLEKVREMLA